MSLCWETQWKMFITAQLSSPSRALEYSTTRNMIFTKIPLQTFFLCYSFIEELFCNQQEVADPCTWHFPSIWHGTNLFGNRGFYLQADYYSCRGNIVIMVMITISVLSMLVCLKYLFYLLQYAFTAWMISFFPLKIFSKAYPTILPSTLKCSVYSNLNNINKSHSQVNFQLFLTGPIEHIGLLQ